ncbi:MAG: oligoribonuclease [Gammaproteobacteria bacterium]
MSNNQDRLVWIDLEMTGLDADHDRIIEIATIVTDNDLNIIAEGPVMAIHQSDERLAGMDEWNTSHHTSSGLVDRVKASEIDEAQAEAETLAFLSQHLEAGVSPMCGNSISQDRRFLYRWMPKLQMFFHYRHLDVSTLKELVNRWFPDCQFEKDSKHLALDDIKDSIEELRYYRKLFFKG